MHPFLQFLAHLRNVAIVLLLAFTTATAQEPPIDEIVVRGLLYDTTLDETARSVSVLELDERHAGVLNHLENLLGQVPNVNFSSGASRARFLQIRGIGERGQFAEPLNASVGLLLDGVDLSGIGTAATLFDVKQVEVLRGPQGTLYGANALAGLVNVISHDPTEEFEARLSTDIGDFGAFGIGGVVSGALSETVAARFAVRQYEDDGFIRNSFLNRDDTTRRDEATMRGKLLWAPSDRSTLRLTLGMVDIDNGYDNFSLDNDRVTRSDEPGRDAQTSRYGSLQWGFDLAPDRELIASLGHASSDIDYGYDEDWTFVGFHPDGYSSTDRYRRDRTTSTLDVRLVSSAPDVADDSPAWVVGIFGLTQSVDLERNYTFLGGPFDSAFDIDRVALYGEAGWPLGGRLMLRAGLRLERHDAAYRDSDGVRFGPSDDLVGGRLQLELPLDDDNFLYAGVTRGYKAGGFNTDGTLDADLREFDPETLWNAEVGWKLSRLDGQLSAQASLFYMWREDVQINTSIVRERPDGSSEFIDFTGNGARGSNAGVELEFNARVTDHLTLYGSIGLLDTEFRNYVNGAGDDLSGREQAQAPSYQFYAGAEYRFPEGWFARIELEGRDRYFFSDSHGVRSESYELLHASVGYESERWSVKLWGRNLTDEDLPVRGFFFGNDPRDGYTSRPFIQLGEPSRVGLTASVNF